MENVINFDLLKEYDGTLKEVLKVWRKQKSYSIDDIIQYKGNYLKCITAGTSGTITLNFTGLDVGDTITDGTVVWEIIEPQSGGGVDLPEWQPNTSYTTGKYLVHEGTVYKVDNDFTSGTTFSDANLTSYIAPIMEGATSSIDGKAGMVIKPTTTDVDKFLKGDGTWGSAGGGISIWQANTQYAVNDVVIDSNLIWQCAVAHTSTSSFDESKWVCISGGEVSNGLEIVTLWEGKYNISNESSSSITNTITLEDSVENYKLLLVQMYAYDTSGDRYLKGNILTIDTSYITYNNSYSFISNFYANYSNNASLEYMFKDSLNMGIAWKNSTGSDTPYITKVQGIRKAKPIVSSGMKYETLWEGEAGVINSGGTTTVSLSIPYSGYKKLGITVNYRDGSSYVTKYHEFDGKSITTTSRLFACFGYDNFDYNIDNLKAIDSTTLSFSYNNAVITKIIGISEGVVVPTGVQAARVTLWEGFYNTSNNSVVITQTQEISSIDGFDQFEVTFDGHVDNTHHEKVTQVYNVSDIVYGIQNFRISVVATNGDGTGASAGFGFVDNTHFGIGYLDKHDWTEPCGFTKIVGIKYIQPDSYSTEEKLIGTWIDGKPLYRKVFTNVTSPFNSGLTSSVVTVVKLYGYLIGYDGTFTQLPNNATELYITLSSGVVNATTNKALNYVVVEYTKN